MSAPTRQSPEQILDHERARREWRRVLPAGVRNRVLHPQDVDRLLRCAEQFLAYGQPEALGELDAQVYNLAGRLQAEIGQGSTLRYLRDGLTCALLPFAGAFPDGPERAARLLSRVSDAIWTAHTDALKDTIQQQRRDRLHQELMVAKRIQERLLPKSIPDIPGFDIAGRVLPAAEVGGDYWSCKSYPEDDIVTLKLADVTGHGVAAATLVAAVKFISGGYYRGSKTAAQVMERTNTVLVRETPHEILVTMVYGWLYPHSGEMSVVNAGHAPVLHYHNGRFRSIAPTGAALGLMETKYREARIAMEPGDVFFTCSDGVTEPSAELALGEDWVREQIVAGADLSAAELVDCVLAEALRYYGTPQDDMSVLVVKRSG
jgi:hypothetical protein